MLNIKNAGPSAGRTLDLTLFAVTRALDVVIGVLWSRRKARRVRTGRWTGIDDSLEGIADAMAFSLASGSIMFAWFYRPEQLPRTYNKWITDMAEIDSRIISALRRIRSGEFVYGNNTGQADLLGSLCKDVGLPEVLGDPAQTVPVPCKLVHGGWTDSCEKHAAWRFWRSWKAAFLMYLPLNILVRLRRPNVRSFVQALLQSARSSAFLGAFVAIFYYSVCLTRTRVGPVLFPKVSPMVWDNQLIVKIGCLLCGWSVLIESPPRRSEMSFFVAPRALGVILPREYSKVYQWRETVAFALSFAIVMTAIRENKARVRGVFGRLLGGITA
ncbi:integral membrane protein [Kalaharituber pfeilii]|nr:integral membrane protein [Kalaharituber pfeilii]